MRTTTPFKGIISTQKKIRQLQEIYLQKRKIK